MDLPILPKTIKLRVEELIRERLTVNPIDLGEKSVGVIDSKDTEG